MDEFFKDVKKEEDREKKKALKKKQEPVFETNKPKKKAIKQPKGFEKFLKLKGISSETTNLTKIPGKDIDRPHEFVPQPDAVHQADVLFLPNDDGFRYLMVVVDVATRLTDAYPMKKKDQQSVIKGFTTIYSRPLPPKKGKGNPLKERILNKPTAMQTDDGAEFTGKEPRQYFKDNGIALRVGKPGRSRQQAMVETRNGMINRFITARQNEEEGVTGEYATGWVEDIPLIVQLLNEDLGRLPPSTMTVGDEPICTKSEKWKERGKGSKRAAQMPVCDLLPEGTKVRAILDKPVSIATGKQVYGGFRVGDARWEKQVRTIAQQILKPGNPPLYLLSGRKNVAYTRAQLQLVDEKESKPSAKNVAVTKFKIDEILNDKMDFFSNKKKKEKVYQVKWEDPTGEFKEAGTDIQWQPAKEVIKDVPELVKQYEEKKKEKATAATAKKKAPAKKAPAKKASAAKKKAPVKKKAPAKKAPAKKAPAKAVPVITAASLRAQGLPEAMIATIMAKMV